MDAGLIERIETGAERGASVLFAAAVGYAVYGFAGAIGFQPSIAACAAGAGALAYLPCSRLLALAGARAEHLPLPAFALAEAGFSDAPGELLLTEPVGSEELLLTEPMSIAGELLLTDRAGPPGELLLTEAERIRPDDTNADSAPLLLDDILADIGPDARVVRLFDRKAMPAPGPTPGELQARIARHLADGALPSAPSDLRAPRNVSAPPDASHALSAALAELRRSLR